jgi:GntR family transcriptional regulator, transcriptional repressor for pyruvate dehydrogenase complex
VISSFFDAILQGEIKIGETLASERELSEKLGISRGSLREGLSILEYLGVLVNNGNRKVVTKDYEIVAKALEIIKVSTQDENDIVNDVMEFRREIELMIVKYACKRATEQNIEKIRNSIGILENDQDNQATADYSFHTALAEASQNSFLVVIEELLISMTKNISSSLINYPGRRKYILDEQKTILKAVIEKDNELAQSTMLKHLFFIEKTLSIINNFRDHKKEEKV